MKRIDLMLRSLVLTGALCRGIGRQASGGHAMLYKFEPDLGNDDFSSDRHPALSLRFEHDLSENRYPLFRIML